MPAGDRRLLFRIVLRFDRGKAALIRAVNTGVSRRIAQGIASAMMAAKKPSTLSQHATEISTSFLMVMAAVSHISGYDLVTFLGGSTTHCG